jgi:hypothetical protein
LQIIVGAGGNRWCADRPARRRLGEAEQTGRDGAKVASVGSR